jgi:diadenosine tetraphosphatase ApaH/serine/threonine PP2A family protein phosphatase
MRTVIVGDVHGCLDELLQLVERCGDPRDTRYVMVGDLVCKGPDSHGVIAWARTSNADAVLGNHDAAVLRALDPKADPSPKAHHASVAATLDEDDWSWLAARPLWLPVDGADDGGASHLVVHGGLVPGVPLEAQERKYLLNLRSITAEGLPTKKIEGSPWASLWKGPPHVVFGHDAVRGLQHHRWATGLDTGCVYGGALTALALPAGELVSIPARRAYAPMK